MLRKVLIVATYDNYKFSAPIEYTLNLILSSYGIEYRIIPFNQLDPNEWDNPLFISYSKDYLLISDRHFHLHASDFFGDNYLKLPVIYPNNDMIASSFFMVSRYEEVIVNHYDRFPANASIAYKEGFLDRPIVNEYIDLLWSQIQPFGLEREPLTYPGNKTFAVCLTHDVDWLRQYSFPSTPIVIGSRIIKHRKPREAVDMTIDYIKVLAQLKRDPFDTFDYIVNLEQSLNFKSTFFFLTDKASKSRELTRELEWKEHEVGLHSNPVNCSIANEKRELNRVVLNSSYGCRQHYLRFKVPDTWIAQQNAGLLYDSTLSFAEHVGFRCGLCTPFQPFNILINQPLSIWELPLTVMDASLHGYQNLSPEDAYREIIDLIKTVKKHGGVFVLLWHNSSFVWKGWKEVYEKVMYYISKQDAWVTDGREIIQWWDNHV